ncbi:MAG: oligosaccharide flippase family protein [Caldilineaceae bacterium]
MKKLRQYRADLLALLTIFILALLWFAPVLFPSLTGATLLPFDNLASFEPWRSLHPNLVPYNNLLSDLVLENAVWKLHIRRALADGQLPLWNPQIFTGLPFLAAGQASTFYPLNVLFYVLPLEVAYGWFTALQIALAGMNMYILGRVLRLRPLPALFAGVVFMFSGFLIVSVVFTMFIAAAVWLPLLLAIIEIITRKQEEKGIQSFHPIPYVAVGAAVIGVMILAGHPELIYYTLLVAGAYALVRLIIAWRNLVGQGAGSGGQKTEDRRQKTEDREQGEFRTPHSAIRILKLAVWLLVMVVLGGALGGVQLLPLIELLPLNFRQGSASYHDVVGWAWPSRHVLTFFLPDVFGNPSHHSWFDIWSRQWLPATVNARGEPNDTIFWGIKNYVEGGNYVGIVTWLLAGVAVLSVILKGRGASKLHSHVERGNEQGQNEQAPCPLPLAPRPSTTYFFAALALISLLFAFGTPLYAILFYGLPGWNQLHSPFRWVYPFTLSMALLGGIGLQTLLETRDQRPETKGRRINLWSLISGLWSLSGLGALALVAASLVAPQRFIQLGQRLVNGSDLGQNAFADGRMLWSYEALNLAKFGLFALLGGLLVWWIGRKGKGQGARSKELLAAGIVLLLALDLYVAHGHFNPASDPKLSPLNAENRPPVVDFINKREGIDNIPHSALRTPHSLWRFTTYNLPGEKTFNANVGMYYGWQDIRGYDSIIPRQYAEFMNHLVPQANELLYNRIAPLYSNAAPENYAILDNPLLNLLNVKYILTEHYLPNPGWQQIYRDKAIGVYENKNVMPRTFIVPAARVTPPDQQPLLQTDLRKTVFIEQPPSEQHADTPASPQVAQAQISRYTANEVFVDVNISDRGWLVLTDAYFPDWKAYLRPFNGDESQEKEINLYRADGAFRTVYLPEQGQWTVRFVYTPMSFKLGIYTSFISLMAIVLLMLYWLWGRYYHPEQDASEVRVVAKNSLAPMVLNLTNKVIDFAYAMLYVRLLGPAGTGQWYFVVGVYGIFEIVSRYGLGTLLTRDVSADKDQSSRYLTNVTALRTLLWLISLPVLALVIFAYRHPELLSFGGLLDMQYRIGTQEVQALTILALSMLFSNWADGLSSTFSAFEKMEYPAGLSSAASLMKVTVGALVLLMGWGFVGLAVTSLLVNLFQLLLLYRLLRSTLFKPQWRWDWPLQTWMMRTSGPLMINHLLATIFWRIDVWILRPLAGEVSVGLYSVGLKYLDGLNIIPSIFTMAIFPLMSRYAKQGGNSLLRSYILSLRLLIILSLPLAMAITFLAQPLVYIVGGAKYLDVTQQMHLFGWHFTYHGGSDLALQLVIWSIPIGFVNSVTQYVLIAVNQQHYLTRAFIIGVIFNIVGNLLLIPGTGFVGASLVTILSEFSLLFPFYYSVKRNVGVVPWFSIYVPPLVAVLVMGSAIYGLLALGVNLWVAVAVGCLIYIIMLFVTGALRGEDMALIARALPLGPLRRWLPAENA